MNFSEKIISWYHKNKRDLPWRNTHDPYKIWLSEIILQQTRVDQGMSYYLKFIKEFPQIKDLANAPEDKVLKLWQGLGYYSRARNLHAAAKMVMKDFNGKFPSSYNDIIKLKGVGQYTAAAVSSIAFNEAQAVVDGNVYRVLSRVFGVKTPIDSTKGKKQFYELANELIDKKNPGTFNQAVMEFGATWCKPQNPNCADCVLRTLCFAVEKKCVNKLPVKSKKIKTRNRHFNYFVLQHKNNIALKKRMGKDIWVNLYEFPLIETENAIGEFSKIPRTELKKIISAGKYILKKSSKVYKHVLSHQIIYAKFWSIELKKPHPLLVSRSKMKNYAVPRLIDRYLMDEELI